MQLILLGCPGAGKGTQAKFISEVYHIPAISTGEILRAAISQGTELGKKVKEIVEGGRLVPDDVMIELVKQRIKEHDCHDGFLLDGFPRTVAQAEALHQIADINFVIDIDLPTEEVVRRLTGRRIHPASGRIYHTLYHPPRVPDKDDVTGDPLIQRPDDSENTVRERLAIYDAQTSPLRNYYLHFKAGAGVQAPNYVKIDGSGSVEDIRKRILSALNPTKLRSY